jgi:hypothetical protein
MYQPVIKFNGSTCNKSVVDICLQTYTSIMVNAGDNFLNFLTTLQQLHAQVISLLDSLPPVKFRFIINANHQEFSRLFWLDFIENKRDGIIWPPSNSELAFEWHLWEAVYTLSKPSGLLKQLPNNLNCNGIFNPEDAMIEPGQHALYAGIAFTRSCCPIYSSIYMSKSNLFIIII